jgi:hypothetical protein
LESGSARITAPSRARGAAGRARDAWERSELRSKARKWIYIPDAKDKRTDIKVREEKVVRPNIVVD